MSRTEEQLAEIARRKERLIARAASHRSAIAECVRGLRGPVSVVDRGFGVVRFLRAHPVLAGAAAAMLVAFRGRGLLSLAGRAYSAWRVWRSLAALWLGRPA